jgi:signal transduction histidine kinase
LVTIAGAVSAHHVESQLDAMQRRYLPLVELGPRLDDDFERLRRAFQDAVAAHDLDTLAGTRDLEGVLFHRLDQAGSVVPPADVAALRAAVDDYCIAARSVAARLIADETGEALVEAMAVMQQKQQHAREELERVTNVDRGAISDAFASIARAESSATAFRLWASLACLLAAMAASLGISRGVLRSLADLGAGLERFGKGQFGRGVEVTGNDELAEVARQANRMAANLDHLTGEHERAELLLRESNRELEAFSYSVAHDLRAPLRAINGFSHALAEDLGPRIDGETRAHLDRIIAAGDRMAQLIEGLLTMARVSRAALQREAFDLSRAADEVVRQLQAGSPERSVEFANQPNVSADGDPVLVRAVLDNLLGNSWKFTGAKREAHIAFGTREDAGETVYFVKDDGAGFDMAYANKLFAPFQRLHQASEFAGTGIGLATVERIVRRHGGRIWAEGAVGRGATFYFTLAPKERSSLRPAAG